MVVFFVITNYFQVRYVFILKSCRTVKNNKIQLRILFLHRFVSIFIEFFSRIKDLSVLLKNGYRVCLTKRKFLPIKVASTVYLSKNNGGAQRAS